MDLLILDLDGVLVDTQDAEDGALAYLGTLMGVHLEHHEAQELFSGKKVQECIDLLEGLAHRPPPPDAVPIVRAKCRELIGSTLEPVPGVREALARVDVPMCVASNSPLELIKERLSDCGIIDHFDGRLYSAYEAGAWKPDPGLFRWAARDQGVPADRCLVVEDSLVGVDAALAAGMKVLQFNVVPVRAPHRAGVPTFSSMHALPGLVHGGRSS
ncbi:HAD-IA family hydrolase [Actinosynnema sp. NPDC047251]|uniref:HAD family hydrolase n=1 Tax=Saccharothrix espanaensis TaxID=103731 RepID=UPI0002DB98C2|nr:HAD-IA family hydrolase [Saccharothrix espanaensis]